MADLIERYIYHVGRYLPKKDRADIEQELRSLIQDQLEDRFDSAPTQEQIASILVALGAPHHMAASYHHQQIFVGPDLYPQMMMALQHVWLIAPTVVLFLSIFGALISSAQGEPRPGASIVIETLAALWQTTISFSAVVVLIFAVMQRVGTAGGDKAAFDPLTLAEVDDPHTVDRFEARVGIVIAACVTLVLLIFLGEGGLTLHFNGSDPGGVIPVPTPWLMLLIGAVIAMLVLHLGVLRRNRWNAALWLTETCLEVFGMICLYFVAYEPLLARLLADIPGLANVPAIDSAPEIVVVIGALITLIGRGSRLVGLWRERGSPLDPVSLTQN